MHKVLLVDDEPFVRVSLASLRNWTDEGFDFCYEAANGQQALDLLQARDDITIILLDLLMPVMDGISFLEAFQDAQTSGKLKGSIPVVIVLSAQDSFHLVRKAFTLGVSDYALKTEIDGDRLLALLEKASERQKETQAEPEQLEDNHREFLRTQMLRDLLADPAPPDHATLFPRFGISLELPLVLCLVRIVDFESVSTRFASDEKGRFNELFIRTLRMATSKRWPGEVVQISADKAVIFVSERQETDWLQEMQTALRESLERYLNVRAETLVGERCARIEDIQVNWEEMHKRRGGGSRIVMMARRYLGDHFAEPEISLSDLAAHVGVSRNHLSWEFTRETGETITEYLAHLRVNEAARLLKATSLKVYEIAEQVGYPNVEHFSRIFKKVMGVSPNRYIGTPNT